MAEDNNQHKMLASNIMAASSNIDDSSVEVNLFKFIKIIIDKDLMIYLKDIS